MRDLEYFRPETVEAAVQLLKEGGEGRLPLMGATDLWVRVREGKLRPDSVVSLRGIGALGQLRRDGGALILGAAVPHCEIEDSAELRRAFPALHRACSSVGSRQVRNVGTVGGNLCNAAPSADSAVPALLYDAVCVAQGPAGVREIPVGEFFVGPGRNSLGPGEILTAVRFPDPGPRTYAEYWKLTRRKGVELPILGVGVRVSLAEDGRTVASARVALGVAGPVPMRARAAEALLEGAPLTRQSVAEAADAAAGEAQVRDSWRGKAWYRRQMVRVLVPRVLERAGAPVG